MKSKLLTLSVIAASILYSNNIKAEEEHSVEVPCSSVECDMNDSINKYLYRTTNAELPHNITFNLIDNGVLVNSKSKGDSTYDGALNCEFDRDYNCEAWEDWAGTKKPWVMELFRLTREYEWYHKIDQGDIDSMDTPRRWHYNFVVGAITVSAAGRAVAMIQAAGKAMGYAEITTTMIAGGGTNWVIGELFQGASKTKLQVGDTIVVKGGAIIAVWRKGVKFTAAELYGSGSGGNNSGGGGGDGSGNASGGSGSSNNLVGSGAYCYRDFSNGQRIQVPCE
ncbi:hypothetical protein [Pseudoalteromonas denitrificans]|uniref:Lipoprotein n=1 Tax=Pseudoalteromonas denitrificans DSM 6059 TaxID=1123010 RepID=A0A1I1I6N9_9GAMM|nr:hypothetical protein [Pseudoalteromonas denitrificans]SFC31874.1 hypothetical protein SAMN02745724_01404 [Pseudoalteromonas denitrificans DSM 6059]